jgi:hypothetical protein
MALKAKKDEVYNMVSAIYYQKVPAQSELSNPFAANKRARKKPLVSKDQKELSDDVNEWNTKNFVDYFSKEYKTHVGGVYKVTYVSDNSIISELMSFMEENLLAKNEWTKKFIDWCFLNKESLLQKCGHFLLPNLRQFLNRFYQESVLVSSNNQNLIDIYDEVTELDNKGRSKEIYSKYGIPIASTYFLNKRNISQNSIVTGLEQLFNNLSTGTQEQKQLLADIFQKSISRSPYLEDFVLLDWREQFKDFTEKYKEEPWYREEDYPGSPRFEFEKFL